MPQGSTDASERILACAGDLFGTRGYDAVAVADIAKASGVSTSLIYYHFKDKESLMRALTERIGSDLVEPTLAVLSGEGSFRERLEAFIEAWVAAAFDNRDLFRIHLHSISNPESLPAAESLTYASQVVEAIASVITEGMHWGEFDPVDPLLAAECLLSLVSTRVAVGEINAPHSRFVEADAEQTAMFISTLFMEGICAC